MQRILQRIINKPSKLIPTNNHLLKSFPISFVVFNCNIFIVIIYTPFFQTKTKQWFLIFSIINPSKSSMTRQKSMPRKGITQPVWQIILSAFRHVYQCKQGTLESRVYYLTRVTLINTAQISLPKTRRRSLARGNSWKFVKSSHVTADRLTDHSITEKRLGCSIWAAQTVKGKRQCLTCEKKFHALCHLTANSTNLQEQVLICFCSLK